MTHSFSYRDYTRRLRVERRRERGRHERWTELGDWLAWAPDESLVFREPPLPFKSWRTWCRDNNLQVFRLKSALFLEHSAYEVKRASGEVICRWCGLPYWKHRKPEPDAVPTLVIDCEGRRLKL